MTFGEYVPHGGFSGFDGELDEVIIVAGVLTEDQVRALNRGDLAASGLDLGE